MLVIFEKIGEEIAVLTKFQKGRVIPTRFLWKGQAYRIVEITARWSVREGQYKNYYFSTLAHTGSFHEISFRTRDMVWILESMGLEG